MARQHFYYHFDNVYDAVRWIFEEEAVALLREHEASCCGRTACSSFSNTCRRIVRSASAPFALWVGTT